MSFQRRSAITVYTTDKYLVTVSVGTNGALRLKRLKMTTLNNLK